MNKQQHTTFDKLCADLEREYPDEMAAARKWAQQLAADIKSGKAKLDIQPFDPNRCLACGENHGSPNLPCPRMRATSVQPSPAPEIEQPEIMGFIRYRVEKTGWGFWPYCVRASGGTRELFVGHLKQCERVAARLSAAFEDGKFIAQQHYQRIDAARVAEIERLKRQVASLRQHKNDYMEAAEETQRALHHEIAQVTGERDAALSRLAEMDAELADAHAGAEREELLAAASQRKKEDKCN